MKAFISRDTYIDGIPVSAGEVVDVDKEHFHQLTQANKAEKFDPNKHQQKKGSK